MSLKPKRYFTTFFVSCLMIIPISACAQEMDRPVVDQFTNDTTLSTTQENVAVGSDEYLEAYYSRIKNVYYLNFRVDILCENHHSFSVAKGNDVIIKLQNGKFMNTFNLDNVKAARQNFNLGNGSYDYWSAYVVCAVTYDEMITISRTGIEAIRVATNKGNIDFNMSDIGKKRLDKMSSLILLY